MKMGTIVSPSHCDLGVGDMPKSAQRRQAVILRYGGPLSTASRARDAGVERPLRSDKLDSYKRSIRGLRLRPKPEALA
jgi:hypothetical protein